MSKAERLQHAVDWITANGMEERFCTLSFLGGKPRISFLTLLDLVKTLKGNEVKVTGSGVPRAMNFAANVDGIEFHCCSSSGCVGPGTYIIDDSILSPELVA